MPFLFSPSYYRYCGALCCGALGTVAAVFLSLAVNECGTDTGAMALLHKVRACEE